MNVEIVEELPTELTEYAQVSITFEVREILSVSGETSGPDGARFTTQQLSSPYWKDYDAVPGHHPIELPSRFDMTNWGILAAHVDGMRAGGAIIAWDSPDIEMLEQRSDLAVLWDLRVAPGHRRKGIGEVLFQGVETWSTIRGARWLKVETQNINAGACKFYANQGCTLGKIDRFAYPDLPQEIQLCWYKELRVPVPDRLGTWA